jgi:hypothetical protein
MTLSRKQKKYVHAALIGFATGVLTALQTAMLAPGGLTESKAALAAGVGLLTAGIGRAAGAVLESIATTEGPKASADTSAKWQQTK